MRPTFVVTNQEGKNTNAKRDHFNREKTLNKSALQNSLDFVVAIHEEIVVVPMYSLVICIVIYVLRKK